jgi:hypothetical protein
MGGIITTTPQKYEEAPMWIVSDDSGTGTKRRELRLDPSLPPLQDKGHIQLYDILQEPVTQKAIGKFATSKNNEHLLMCWAEIEEFKEEVIERLRQHMMREIYAVYIKPGSSMQIVGLSQDFVDTCTPTVSTNVSSNGSQPTSDSDISFFAEVTSNLHIFRLKLITANFIFVLTFLQLQFVCFLKIYEDIYIDFSSSEEFKGIRKGKLK